MSNLKEAQQILLNKLKGQPWLRDIGITQCSEKYCLKVNVSHLNNDIMTQIPLTVNGFAVIFDVVGNIKAY